MLKKMLLVIPLVVVAAGIYLWGHSDGRNGKELPGTAVHQGIDGIVGRIHKRECHRFVIDQGHVGELTGFKPAYLVLEPK